MDEEMVAVVRELHSLELPWQEVLPQNMIEWLDVFSNSYNVVKEIMFPGILTALSGLMAPRTTLKMSAIEFEPVNIFSIVLAQPGAGKSAALNAAVQAPIIDLEENEGTPILIEDFSKSGVFIHLKTTGGVGILAKDEVHVFMEALLGKSRTKDLDKDILIKFFDNQSWMVNKGNTNKRDRIPRTSLAFFGLSQPDSFLKLYGQMATKGNGLVDRILCCCPLPRRLSRVEVNENVEKLERYSATARNLNHIYEFVYHTHQDVHPVTYTLSREAYTLFVEEEKKLVEAQNAVFSSCNSTDSAANISKAAKLALRLAVVLHVFIDRMTQALGQGSFRETSTAITEESMQRAFALANWFMDNRYILEKTVQTKEKSSGTYSMAKKILWSEGPFITYRLACRLTHAMSSSVVEAMKKLQADGLGILDEDVKCFYKYAPLFIPEDKLQIYGGDIIDYSTIFRQRNAGISQNQWTSLVQHCPNREEVNRYFPA